MSTQHRHKSHCCYALVLAVNSTGYKFYGVTHSYFSCLFLCTLGYVQGWWNRGGARGALAPPILDLRTRTLRMRALHADNRLASQPLTPASLNVYLSAASGYVCVSVVSQLNYQRTRLSQLQGRLRCYGHSLNLLLKRHLVASYPGLAQLSATWSIEKQGEHIVQPTTRSTLGAYDSCPPIS